MSDVRSAIYSAVLARGAAGRDAYYDALRAAGIAPTPADEPGHLYAPNPVVLPRAIARAMVEDLNRFCEARRRAVPDAERLLALAPAAVRTRFASRGVAERLFSELRRAHPWACLDAYLVETPAGLDRAYLEWQTFPAYVGLGLATLGATRRVFPEIEALGGTLLAGPERSLEALRERLTRLLTRDLADARQGVIVDYEPARQETRREFRELQALTGGPESGFGVIDPREVRYVDGRPCYRRSGVLVPIVAVVSRLVAQDLEHRLLPALRGEEEDAVRRFFADDALSWIVHPLHFSYGSKRDFPEFHAAGLSRALPPCEVVTAATIAAARARGADRLRGLVQKPVDGSGGSGVVEDPRPDELSPGALLQATIRPAACHATLAGARIPEVRVMGIPAADGSLDSPIVFTRVKAPDVFRSNAGVTARANVPGTGEGYAVFA